MKGVVISRTILELGFCCVKHYQREWESKPQTCLHRWRTVTQNVPRNVKTQQQEKTTGFGKMGQKDITNNLTPKKYYYIHGSSMKMYQAYVIRQLIKTTKKDTTSS